MQPNLEIRERVAREVMGLKVRWWDGSMRPWVDMEPQDISERRPVPAYESDLAAAFDVVEKMRERGWKLAYLRSSCSETAGDYDACFRKGPKVESAQDIAGAPKAICLAALAAIESEKTR